MQYLSKWKQEIMFNVWLSQRNEKYDFFLNRKRNEREKAKISIIANSVAKTMPSRTDAVRWKGLSRLGADLIVWEILDPKKLIILIYFFFGKLSNFVDVTCWSREERATYCREKAQQPTHGGGRKPLLLWITVTEIHRWSSRKQSWTELITIDEIRPLGNKRNNHINHDFPQSETDRR